MGRNVAEAINYGCAEWNSRYEQIPCSCKDKRKNEVDQDKTVVVTHKRLAKRLHKCSEKDCNEVFVTKNKIELHNRTVHKTNYRCSICLKVFHLERNLRRHEKQHLPDRQKSVCSACGKEVFSLSDHQRKFHGERQRCKKCKKMFPKHKIGSQEKTCHLHCSLCPKICTNQRYLTMHTKSKHKG